MILGDFGRNGRPFIQGRLFIPRLRVQGDIDLLVDTGADRTVLHPRDSRRLKLPYKQLQASMNMSGIGGSNRYFVEEAYLFFADGQHIRVYNILIGVLRSSQPDALKLPSLLGRDILDKWWMRYDPPNKRLEFTVKSADFTLRSRAT